LLAAVLVVLAAGAPHAVKAAAAAATPSVKMNLFVILNRFPLKGFF